MIKRVKNIVQSFAGAELAQGVYHGSAALVDRAAFFILFVVIGRVFGESELGKISAALHFANILHTISDFGLPVIIQRAASRGEDSGSIIRNSVFIKIIASIIFYFAVLLYSGAGTGIELEFLSVIYLAVVIFALSNYFLVYFVGINRNREFFILQLVPRILLLILFFAAVVQKRSELVPYTILAAAVFQLLLAISRSGKMKQISNLELPSISHIIHTLRQSYPVWLGLVFVFSYDKIDVLIITGTLGTAETGSYFSAYTIMRSLVIFTSFYLTLYFTKLSASYKNDKRVFSLQVRQSLLISLVLGLGLFAVFQLLSKPILIAVYGERFINSAEILKMLAFAIPLMIFNYNLGSIFNAMDLPKIPMWGGAIAFFVNLPLNLIFIPKYGVIAAAYITIITEGVMFAFLLAHYFRKCVPRAAR